MKIKTSLYDIASDEALQSMYRFEDSPAPLFLTCSSCGDKVDSRAGHHTDAGFICTLCLVISI